MNIRFVGSERPKDPFFFFFFIFLFSLISLENEVCMFPCVGVRCVAVLSVAFEQVGLLQPKPAKGQVVSRESSQKKCQLFR